MDISLLNRKQLAGVLQLHGIDTANIVNDLADIDPQTFTSINLAKSKTFESYPLAHRHCYDTFFKGEDEQSLSSDRYVQYSFTEQNQCRTVSEEQLNESGSTVKSRLRRLQKDSPHYIREADDTSYTELTPECPESVVTLINQIRAIGDVVARVRLAGLAPGHVIQPHRDHDPTKLVRLHIPIKTNPFCTITTEDKNREMVSTYMEKGSVFLLNTGRKHAASNHSNEWRVHLLIDIHGQKFLSHFHTTTIVS